MGITLENIDQLRARAGISYREAKEILEKHQGDVVEALIELESRQTERLDWKEEISLRSGEVVDKVKALLQEGKVTRIRVKSEGQTIMEIPIALGAIGAVALPSLAALGVMVALFKRCSIEVIRAGDNNDAENISDSRETDTGAE